MKFSSVLTSCAVLLAALPLVACDGLKEAMTAHVDTVAQAGSQELSVEQLAQFVSDLNTEPRKEIVAAVANTWIDYQLLAQAAANGDTAAEAKDIDASLWFMLSNIKAQRFMDSVSKTWPTVDSAKAVEMYNNGDMLAAAHILVLTQGASADELPELRLKANHIRTQVTPQNFAHYAKEVSDDQGSARNGGALGLFPKGMMVGPFEQALLALKPGEISPVVETRYGYHIIYRMPLSEIPMEQLIGAATQQSMASADSVFQAKLRSDAEVEFHKDAPATIRTVLNDPQNNLENTTVIATYTGNKFTAGRLAEWMGEMPPRDVYQQRMQLSHAPDSILPQFAERLITNELIVRAAEQAKVQVPDTLLTKLRQQFADVQREAFVQLGVDPKTLADSATGDNRQVYAVKRANDYIEKLMRGEAPSVNAPPPIVRLLRDKSKVSINQTGLDRAVERATTLYAEKQAADSVRNSNLPKSEVPMPGSEAPAEPTPSEPTTSALTATPPAATEGH